jgi:hypothetical protein
MGFYSHILFHQAVSATVSHGPDVGHAYTVAEALERGD